MIYAVAALLITVGAVLLATHGPRREGPEPTPQPAPEPEPEKSVLVAAAERFPGVKFHHGRRSDFLVELAQGYAQYMAKLDSQAGHAGWDFRYRRIWAALGMRAVEVTAESWDRQANAPMDEIGDEMFRTWRQSDGPPPKADHWGVVSEPHTLYGDGLAKSQTGIWYACIIVAD